MRNHQTLSRGLLEESNEGMDRLREIIEGHGGEDGGSSERWRRRADELEGDNEDLRAKVEEQAEEIAQREDEKEPQSGGRD